jgi:cytochrome c biogenesis protein CcmG, thiol:disulfide interchange protein DsbE
MRLWVLVTVSSFFISARLAPAAEETLTALRVGSEVYSNVTVLGVTATHLTFTHNRGVTSAKLNELEPAMQKHFHFDPQTAATVQAEQKREDQLYRLAARSVTNSASASTPRTNNFPLLAKSFLNRTAPELYVEKWISDAPDMKGKFVLVDIWATWCPPCRRAIPHLNELHAKYQDRLVVIGLSREAEREIRRMTEPQIDYAVASDTQGRTSQALEVKGIPHLLLIDPKGIVRFQGLPQALPDEELENLLTKYAAAVEEKPSP